MGNKRDNNKIYDKMTEDNKWNDFLGDYDFKNMRKLISPVLADI